MLDIHMLGPKTDPAGTFYRIAFDPAAQIIHARLTGFWDPSVVEDYGVDAKPFLVASRRQLGFVRVLMDRRESIVQSAKSAEAIRAQSRSLYNPDDYIAVVLDSALAQMQLRRMVEHDRTQVFTDIGEAEVWLRAQGAAG